MKREELIMIGVTIFTFSGVVLFAGLILWLMSERWRLLRRSTWKAIKAGGLRNVLNFRSLRMYAYLRWHKLYVKALINHAVPKFAPRMGKKVKKWLVDRYHCKVLTPEHAHAIIANDQEIPLHDLEQIIPYSMARKLILNGPPDIAVQECPCRNAREDPCYPTQVCIVVGQPFVDFILEHNPQDARRLTQPEALELLRAEHESGHVHTAWFRDSCLERFFVICNCCECCCGGIEAMVKYGVPTMASSGYTAHVDEKRCAACGICEEYCPFGAIQVDDIAIVNWDVCMGCGVCAGKCPNEAAFLIRDERKGIPLDVRLLA